MLSSIATWETPSLLFLCHHYTILSATLQEGLEICGRKRGEAEEFGMRNSELWGAGLQWRPLPQAKAPTESADEIRRLRRCVKIAKIKLSLCLQKLQIVSLADDLFQIQKRTADTIYPLPAMNRLCRGRLFSAAAQWTRDHNSEFRINQRFHSPFPVVHYS